MITVADTGPTSVAQARPRLPHALPALFFILLFIAALTSSISLLEVVCAYFIDKGWPRAKAAWVLGIVIFAIGVPSAISLTGGLKVAGKDFLDAMDFISSNVLLPLGGVFISLFVGWFWTADARKEVSNNGEHSFGLMEPWMWVCKVLAPVAILYIFITGLKW